MGETNDIASLVMDEIALEGLDGVTIEALFKRLVERHEFASSLNDAYKEYIWEIIASMNEIEMFELPEPRKLLVIFNRYDYVDPELGMILEPDVPPEEIYPHYAVYDKENNIRGSCPTYYTRVSVNSPASQLPLKEVLERWGTKLVLVASQRMRNLALMGPSVDPELEMTIVQYCILERIGRSRYLGEVTQGRVSLQVTGEDPKALFYHRKFLMRNGLIVKQIHHQKSGTQNCSGSLLHLPRFYVERVPKVLLLTQRVVEILRTRKHCLAEYEEIRRELGLTGSLKKLFLTSYFQRFVRTDLRLPYRHLYPDAKMSEWRSNNNLKEKMLRVIQLLDPNTDIESVSARDEDEEVEEEEHTNTTPYLNFKKTLNRGFLTQSYECMEQVGVNGYSQMELVQSMGLPKLNARTVSRNLLKRGLVSTFMNDVGRQRVARFRARKWDEQCTRIQNIERDIQNMRAELLSKALGAGHEVSADGQTAAEELQVGNSTSEGTAKRPGSPLQSEPPVKMIRVEGNEIRSISSSQDSSATLESTSQETSLQEQSHKREEATSLSAYMPYIGDKILCKESMRKSNQHQSKDTTVMTYRIFKRINMILEFVKIHKVVDDHSKFLKLINEEEEREGLNMKMDKKSLLRLLIRLQEDGHLKLHSYLLTDGHKTKNMFFICDRDVPLHHLSVVSAVEQAKMKLFIVNRDNINLAMAGSGERPIVRRQPGTKKQKMTLVYDKTLGRKFGFCPKFPRMRTLHEFLFYLVYGYEGNTHLDQSAVIPFLQSKEIAVDEALCSELTQVYVMDINWKMFIPPLPKYTGWPRGWSIMCDLLLRLPLSLFVKVFNMCYVVEGLQAYLQHPVRRHFLVRQLPAPMRNGLMAFRKYIFSIHEVLQRLCYIGLLQFGPQRLKEKDQVLVYLNRRTTLLDTVTSKPGYHQISEGRYPEIKHEFNTKQDVESYWYSLWNICLHTQLGGRMCVQGKDIILEQLATKPAMLVALQPVRPSLAPSHDTGAVPGDQRGAGGLDSAIFAHLKRNWNWISTHALKLGEMVKKMDRRKHQLMNLKAAPVIFTKSTIIVKRSINYLHNGRFVRPERRQSQVAVAVALPPPGAEVLPRLKKKQRKNIVRRVEPRKCRGTHRPYYDSVDLKALQLMSKLRVDWSTEEDILLLLCKVASMYLCPNPRQQTIALSTVRDILHENIPEANNKTSRACQRRILYMIKNLATSNNLAMNLEELKQDEDIVQRFGSPEENMRRQNESVKDFEERIHEKYRLLVNELQGRADRLVTTSGTYCTNIPDTISEFWKTFDVVEPRTAIKYKGSFQDVKNIVDIHCGVVNAIIHSSLCSVADKTSWAFQLFRVYQQYPDSLLRAAIAKLRQDQMVSMKKTYSRHNQKGNYLPLSSSPYQLSVSYLQLLQTKYQYSVYHETFLMVQKILRGKQEPQGIPVTHASGGAAAAMVELLCKRAVTLPVEIPEQVIILDPWVTEKDETFTRIVARYRDILQTYGRDSTTSALFRWGMSEKDNSENEDPEAAKKGSENLFPEPASVQNRSVSKVHRNDRERDKRSSVKEKEGAASPKKRALAPPAPKKRKRSPVSKKSAPTEGAEKEASSMPLVTIKPSSSQELESFTAEEGKQGEEKEVQKKETPATQILEKELLVSEENVESNGVVNATCRADECTVSETEKSSSPAQLDAEDLPIESSEAADFDDFDDTSGELEICLDDHEEKPEMRCDRGSPVLAEESVESMMMSMFAEKDQSPGKSAMSKRMEVDTSMTMEALTETLTSPDGEQIPSKSHGLLTPVHVEHERSSAPQGTDKLSRLREQDAVSVCAMSQEIPSQSGNFTSTVHDSTSSVAVVDCINSQGFSSTSAEKTGYSEKVEVSTLSPQSVGRNTCKDSRKEQELEFTFTENDSILSEKSSELYEKNIEAETAPIGAEASITPVHVSSSTEENRLIVAESVPELPHEETPICTEGVQSSRTQEFDSPSDNREKHSGLVTPPLPAQIMYKRPRLSAEVVEFTRALELEVAPALQEAEKLSAMYEKMSSPYDTDLESPKSSVAAEPSSGDKLPFLEAPAVDTNQRDLQVSSHEKCTSKEIVNKGVKGERYSVSSPKPSDCSDPSTLETVTSKQKSAAFTIDPGYVVPKKSGDTAGKKRKTPPPLVPLSVYLKGTKTSIEESCAIPHSQFPQSLLQKSTSSSEINKSQSELENQSGDIKIPSSGIIQKDPSTPDSVSKSLERETCGFSDQKSYLSPLPDLVKLEHSALQAGYGESSPFQEPRKVSVKEEMDNKLAQPPSSPALQQPVEDHPVTTNFKPIPPNAPSTQDENSALMSPQQGQDRDACPTTLAVDTVEPSTISRMSPPPFQSVAATSPSKHESTVPVSPQSSTSSENSPPKASMLLSPCHFINVVSSSSEDEEEEVISRQKKQKVARNLTIDPESIEVETTETSGKLVPPVFSTQRAESAGRALPSLLPVPAMDRKMKFEGYSPPYPHKIKKENTAEPVEMFECTGEVADGSPAIAQDDSFDPASQDRLSKETVLKLPLRGIQKQTLPVPSFQSTEMNARNDVTPSANERLIPLIIISRPDEEKMETEEIPHPTEVQSDNEKKLPVIIVSGPAEEIQNEAQPTGSSQISIPAQNKIGSEETASIPSTAMKENTSLDLQYVSTHPHEPSPSTSQDNEVEEEDPLKLLSQVAFESVSALPVMKDSPSIVITPTTEDNSSITQEKRDSERASEEIPSPMQLESEQSHELSQPTNLSCLPLDDQKENEEKSSSDMSVPNAESTSCRAEEEPSSSKEVEEKKVSDEGDEEGRKPSKIMQRTLNQRWRRLEFDWVSEGDWNNLSDLSGEMSSDRQPEVSEDLEEGTDEEKMLMDYADNEGEEGGSGALHNHVARAASRIALFMLREEMDESNQVNHKQHAHDFFVVNSCSVFCQMTEELKALKAKEGEEAVQKKILCLNKELINKVVEEVKSKMIVDLVEDLERVHVAFLERASPEHWKVVCTLVRYVESKKSLGATLKQLRNHYGHRLTELSLAKTLALLDQTGLVVRTGITALRYVHKSQLRPWLVHTFKFLRLEREKQIPITARVIQCSDEETSPVSATAPSGPSEETHKEAQRKETEEPMSVERSDEQEKVQDCDTGFDKNQGECLASSGSASGETTKDSSELLRTDVRESSESEGDHAKMKNGKEADKEVLHKRKHSGPKDAETEDITNAGPVLRSREMRRSAEKFDLSDSEQIHVAIRPWVRINGTLNRRVLDRLLGAVLGHAMFQPGQSLDMFGRRFQPAIQPVHTRELIEILQKLGCIKLLVQVERQKVTLFSKPKPVVLVEADGTEEENEIIVEPRVDAICRLGEFIGEKSYGQDFLAAQEQMFAGTGRPGKRKATSLSGHGEAKKARTSRHSLAPELSTVATDNEDCLSATLTDSGFV